MLDLFEQLKQNYQPMLDTIQNEGAQLQNLNVDGNQLYLKATATSEAGKKRIWDAIKRVDPQFRRSQARYRISSDRPDLPVQPGDNLSKISRQFYGDPNRYKKIVDANKLEDADKIKAGQELIIPAAYT